MAVILTINNQPVLRASNSIYSLLHETINQLIEEKKINNINIRNLLHTTNQEIYGPGSVFADLAFFLKTKQDADEFILLIQAFWSIKFETLLRSPGCFSHIQEFQNELIKFSSNLS